MPMLKVEDMPTLLFDARKQNLKNLKTEKDELDVLLESCWLRGTNFRREETSLCDVQHRLQALLEKC